MKAYVELFCTGGRRATVDISAIKAIFTHEGVDNQTVVGPDTPHTMLLNDGTQFDFFNCSVEGLLAHLMTWKRIDGWLRTP